MVTTSTDPIRFLSPSPLSSLILAAQAVWIHWLTRAISGSSKPQAEISQEERKLHSQREQLCRGLAYVDPADEFAAQELEGLLARRQQLVYDLAALHGRRGV